MAELVGGVVKSYGEGVSVHGTRVVFKISKWIGLNRVPVIIVIRDWSDDDKCWAANRRFKHNLALRLQGDEI